MSLARVAVAALVLLTACQQAPAPKPAEQSKPQLFVLTSLPIAWSEEFALDRPQSPVLSSLEQDYRVTLIDLPSQLPKKALLLAAQPRALPAEELVRLDAWVRDGGRMLLLADPMLEWPSDLPLGDKRRPPIAFADTGLLQHWGLRLDAPEERGPRRIRDGDLEVLYTSPGRLVRLNGSCRVAGQGIAADCSIGRGHVLIVADADWLNFEAVEAAGIRTHENEFALDALLGAFWNDHERDLLKSRKDEALTR